MKLGLFESARELLVLAETSTVDAQPRIRRDYTVVEVLWRVYVDGLADRRR